MALALRDRKARPGIAKIAAMARREAPPAGNGRCTKTGCADRRAIPSVSGAGNTGVPGARQRIRAAERWLNVTRCEIRPEPGAAHRSFHFAGDTMAITIAHLQPIVALIAGVLILIMPRLLNFIVAIYLIVIGLIGLNIIH
jgi:hypothetical protein